MSGDSDMHQLLGELKADMASSQRQRSDLFMLIRDMSTKLTQLTSDIKHHMEAESAHLEKTADIDRRVGSLEGLRNKAIGAWLLLTALSSGLLTSVSSAIGWKQ